MLKACTHLAHFKSVKGGNLVGYACLFTLLGVEATLTEVVGTAADDIAVTGEEQRVSRATANINNVFIKHIESLNSCWDDSAFDLLVPKLAVIVPTP